MMYHYISDKGGPAMTVVPMVSFARVSWSALVLTSLILLAFPCFAAPNVVVTIKPIHSLAAAIF